MLHSEYADAVRVTATDLDAVVPGWYDRVDLDLLAMATTRRCVFGQVFGHHATGLDRLLAYRGPTPDGARWYRDHLVASAGACPAELWRREVLARRNADRAELRATVRSLSLIHI